MADLVSYELDSDIGPPPPKGNADLQGHEDAERLLLEAYLSKRLHHAWLITGPKGIGKATLAYRFARFVLNQGPLDTKPGLFGDTLPTDPPTCLHVPAETSVFQRVAAGGHGDLLPLERRINDKTGKLKSVIDVETVREVSTMMAHTSAEGGWRVVVVDCADDMNKNAANALLKVLEEPPKNALLLLVSHNPGRLLPTIRSRCRVLPLRPLPAELVTKLTHTYAPELADENVQKLTNLCEGSIGRALGLVDVDGLDLYDELMGLLHDLPTVNVKDLHALADKVARASNDEAFQTVTSLLRWWLERIILVASGKTQPMGPDTDFMHRLAGQASLESWFLVWEKINSMVARCNGLNLDKKQILINAFMGLENTVRDTHSVRT